MSKTNQTRPHTENIRLYGPKTLSHERYSNHTPQKSTFHNPSLGAHKNSKTPPKQPSMYSESDTPRSRAHPHAKYTFHVTFPNDGNTEPSLSDPESEHIIKLPPLKPQKQTLSPPNQKTSLPRSWQPTNTTDPTQNILAPSYPTEQQPIPQFQQSFPSTNTQLSQTPSTSYQQVHNCVQSNTTSTTHTTGPATTSPHPSASYQNYHQQHHNPYHHQNYTNSSPPNPFPPHSYNPHSQQNTSQQQTPPQNTGVNSGIAPRCCRRYWALPQRDRYVLPISWLVYTFAVCVCECVCV